MNVTIREPQIRESASAPSIKALPRIACIATMATRRDTFSQVFERIAPQCDAVHVYVDDHQDVPAIVRSTANAQIFSAGTLGASSRFSTLRKLTGPAVIIPFDDDIEYPPDYVHTVVDALAAASGKAVVGYHGNIYLPPHQSYARHRFCYHFEQGLKTNSYVHDVGCGTCAFVSSELDFDPAEWPDCDLDDILLAIEAQKRQLPRVALKRPPLFLKALSRNQPDSLWARAQTDDSRHSAAMKRLLRQYVEP
jgi:hypothetical protein